MRVMSLFAGYGGLDLALGMVFPEARTVYVSDIEEGPCRVLAHRFPEATNLGDVTAVDWASRDPVDVVIGGSPCPDLSDAGFGGWTTHPPKPAASAYAWPGTGSSHNKPRGQSTHYLTEPPRSQLGLDYEKHS